MSARVRRLVWGPMRFLSLKIGTVRLLGSFLTRGHNSWNIKSLLNNNYSIYTVIAVVFCSSLH